MICDDHDKCKVMFDDGDSCPLCDAEATIETLRDRVAELDDDLAEARDDGRGRADDDRIDYARETGWSND
jgi:hypothetical protein